MYKTREIEVDISLLPPLKPGSGYFAGKELPIVMATPLPGFIDFGLLRAIENTNVVLGQVKDSPVKGNRMPSPLRSIIASDGHSVAVLSKEKPRPRSGTTVKSKATTKFITPGPGYYTVKLPSCVVGGYMPVKYGEFTHVDLDPGPGQYCPQYDRYGNQAFKFSTAIVNRQEYVGQASDADVDFDNAASSRGRDHDGAAAWSVRDRLTSAHSTPTLSRHRGQETPTTPSLHGLDREEDRNTSIGGAISTQPPKRRPSTSGGHKEVTTPPLISITRTRSNNNNSRRVSPAVRPSSSR